MRPTVVTVASIRSLHGMPQEIRMQLLILAVEENSTPGMTLEKHVWR